MNGFKKWAKFVAVGVTGGLLVGGAASTIAYGSSIVEQRSEAKIERTDQLTKARYSDDIDSTEIPGLWTLVSIEEDASEYPMAFNMTIGDCMDMLAPMNKRSREAGSPRRFSCLLQER